MVGINMNEALDDSDIGPPVVSHISAGIGQSAAQNSKGFGIFIDEAAKLSRNEGFKLLMMEMYREYRKLDGLVGLAFQDPQALFRSEEHTSELQSLMRISYAVFCLKN